MTEAAEAVVLFRPVGSRELELFEESGFRRFPPRLPEQPIFDPATNARHERKTAGDWNARFKEDATGLVTRLAADGAFHDRFETQTVGAAWHEDCSTPAERLDEFNRRMVGDIKVIASFVGAPAEADEDKTC